MATAKKTTTTKRARTTKAQANGSTREKKTSFKFNVMNRFVLVKHIIGAGSGGMEEFLRMNEMKRRFGFSDQEKDVMEYKELPGGNAQWKMDVVPDKPFLLTEKDIEVIKLRFKVMGAEGAMSFGSGYCDVFAMFFSEKEQTDLLNEIIEKKKKAEKEKE